MPKPAAASVGATGATLRAGGYRVSIPALESVVETTWRAVPDDEFRTPRPGSTVLAAASLEPANTITPSMMTLSFPLDEGIEPGRYVQLLTFNRSMDAYFVVDEARVTGRGTATFHTDVYSQYLVIARPELVEQANLDCQTEPLALRERQPGPVERAVTGDVAPESRLSRDAAFAHLADLRTYEGHENIVFKNEERRFSGQNGRPVCHDEDYLVDPSLAQATIDLGASVRAQWRDPISGEPAFQLRITDAYDSLLEHSNRSNHYRGLAVELTLAPVPAANRATRAALYGRLSSLAVCAGYDFVHFENRHHVHASSRGTVPIAITRLDEEAHE